MSRPGATRKWFFHCRSAVQVVTPVGSRHPSPGRFEKLLSAPFESTLPTRIVRAIAAEATLLLTEADSLTRLAPSLPAALTNSIGRLASAMALISFAEKQSAMLVQPKL